MQTKKPTTVISVRLPADLGEAVVLAAEARRITVNEMLRLDIAAKYHCGDSDRKSLQNVQSADTFIPEDEDE